MKRTIEVFLVIALVVDVAYWSIWWTSRDTLASEHRPAYYEFENAFPLADAWLGLTCLLALLSLRRGRPTALLWLLCAGSAGLYLFGMDLLYDLEHGIFARGGGGAVEAGIVTLTAVFSVTVLRWAWTRREELLGRPAPSGAG
ncbi:hypothetical protein G5V58_17185 [Nocardioides anomalus]|uniref:Uncharacterized protein n=1 Tax=Nocardioides anomalus TaxID=2712223 RepID=A0A6G6WGE0_9ACTN|nr:hypothetical protein [Nocardioides anomalus]QIG44276.1 hypothetical protein G5V58_17185 [Nocardioides anomalus]